MELNRANLFSIVARELAAAFGVLSLILLFVGHQPIDGDERDIYRLADGSLPVICGPGILPVGEADYSRECDVCRISSGIDLPQVPCGPGERFALESNVSEAVLNAPDFLRPVYGPALARAPPKTV